PMLRSASGTEPRPVRERLSRRNGAAAQKRLCTTNRSLTVAARCNFMAPSGFTREQRGIVIRVVASPKDLNAVNRMSAVQALKLSILLSAACVSSVRAQSTGATFGDVIALGGPPSDIVLDELRGRLYLVNNNKNSVDVYDYNQKQVVANIKVGTTPLA